MLPPRRFRRFGRRIDLLECFAFCFEISSCVQVGRVQSSVPEPISDDCRIDARGNQLDSNAVSKRMWADAFFRERWRLLGCCLNILLEFESYTCSAERSAIANSRRLAHRPDGAGASAMLLADPPFQATRDRRGFSCLFQGAPRGQATRTELPEDTHSALPGCELPCCRGIRVKYDPAVLRDSTDRAAGKSL